MAAGNPPSGGGVPFWRDIRFWQVFLQIVFLIVVFLALRNLVSNVFGGLEAQGQTPNFAFLDNRAGFSIGGADNYSPDDSYFQAYLVGLTNSLRVISVGLVAATLLGIFFGIFLLSSNWLVKTLARVYVEILRNTPLLVQLFVWYFVVVLSLPALNDAIELPRAGLAAFPLRWLLYAFIGYLVTRYNNNVGADEPRRFAAILGFIGAASIWEIGFWQVQQAQLIGTPAALMRAAALSGGNLSAGGFWVYLFVSVGLFALVWFAVKQPNARFALLGLVGGQFLGGLLFYFNTVPGQVLRFEVVPLVSLSIKGIVLPEMSPTERFTEWLAFVALGVLLAVGIWFWLGRITETTGKPFPRTLYGLLAIGGFAVVGWLFVAAEPVPEEIQIFEGDTVRSIELEEAREEGLIEPDDEPLYARQPILVRPPQRQGLRFAVGTELSPEYTAILLGLVIYTSAFIAEIVRAGIQAVPNGQIEAARAIGLRPGETLQMVVLPQALRVIIPPMGNQYLNLAKNSSLAIIASYADIYQVMNTIINQSGQSVSGIVIIMGTYLVISLTISAVMNWVNSRFQLVTR